MIRAKFSLDELDYYQIECLRTLFRRSKSQYSDNGPYRFGFSDETWFSPAPENLRLLGIIVVDHFGGGFYWASLTALGKRCTLDYNVLSIPLEEE